MNSPDERNDVEHEPEIRFEYLSSRDMINKIGDMYGYGAVKLCVQALVIADMLGKLNVIPLNATPDEIQYLMKVCKLWLLDNKKDK